MEENRKESIVAFVGMGGTLDIIMHTTRQQNWSDKECSNCNTSTNLGQLWSIYVRLEIVKLRSYILLFCTVKSMLVFRLCPDRIRPSQVKEKSVTSNQNPVVCHINFVLDNLFYLVI